MLLLWLRVLMLRRDEHAADADDDGKRATLMSQLQRLVAVLMKRLRRLTLASVFGCCI